MVRISDATSCNFIPWLIVMSNNVTVPKHQVMKAFRGHRSKNSTL
jgi:hypothetical protein